MQLITFAVVLVFLAGLASMADAALATVSPARAAEMAREGERGARALAAVASDVVRHLNLLLLLRLLCELTATTLVALVAVDSWGVGWRAALVTAGAMTLVSFVVVGVAPRTVGRQHAYAVGRAAAPLIRWLGKVLNPLASLLILIGNAVTPGKGFPEGPFGSQVELRELVDLAEQRGVVEHGERDMIHSVFALGDTIAREVMVPRTEMVWIEAPKTLQQALYLFLRSGFSRIPVIGESVDDVLGVLYLKDVIRRTQSGDPAATAEAVADLMRPATFVPESKPVDDLLSEMQAARTHLVIVVDEYGGTAGLVTIEDILEEIVGEITDEYDVERPPVEHLRRRRGAGHRPPADRGPRRALRRRAARRRGGDRRRPAGPDAGPGADPGRLGRRRRPAPDRRGHHRPAQPDRLGAGAPGRPAAGGDESETTSETDTEERQTADA